MPKFDVIIIGAGLGGLICGYILTKEGYKVCIVEKHHAVGGCLQTFKRNNVVFDAGMHYVGGLAKDENLYKILKYLGVFDKLEIKKLDEACFDLIYFQGKEYAHAMGYERFADTLITSFPNEREAIQSYVKKMREIAQASPVYNIQEVTNNSIIKPEYISTGIYPYIQSITKNTILQNILTATNSLYAGVYNKTPLYVHALIANSYIKDTWRFINGGDQIPILIAQAFINMGGTILLNSEVSHFVFKTNEVSAIELKTGEQIESKYFISNLHPARTFEMIEPDRLQKAYRTRICGLENTRSIFSLYIVLNENSFEYFNYNYYYYKNNDVWRVADYTDHNWPLGYMLVCNAVSGNSHYTPGLTVMTYMNFADLEQWKHTTVEKRGEEYRTFKQRKAEKLLDLVEQRFPNIRSCIKAYYTSTPLTYRDYTGTVNGSMYGVLRDFNAPNESYIPPRTKIRNLLLTGQNINAHGVLGVGISALLTCSSFIEMNELIKRIQNA